MRIVVVGAGVVGFHLAQQVSLEGHDISVVDSNPELVQRITERMDVLAIQGDASCPSVLEKAGAPQADLVIAVTNQDTTNLLVCMLARKMGARKRILRARNAEFTGEKAFLSREEIGADLIINPVETTVELLERLIRNPGATDFSQFAGGDLCLWGFRISPDSPMVGARLKHLREKYLPAIEALIVAIERPDGSIVIPTGEDQLLAGDHIYVFIRRKATAEFRRLVHPVEERIDKVVIAGASQLGVELARRLEGRIKTILLVEPKRERAEEAAKSLGKSVVLRGEVADPDFAREYGFVEADYFLALDADDHTNLLNGLLVMKMGVRRAAVLAQAPQLLPVLRSLGIDAVVNPRLITVSAILRHIRRGRVLQVSRIGESGAEAREYIATKGSAVVGRPLKDLGMPRGAIIGAIFRADSFEIPRGDSMVQVGDHVVILALPEAIEKVEHLFQKRRIFHRD